MYHWLAQAFGHARIRIMEVPSPVATLFFPFLDASFMRECVNACSGPANLSDGLWNLLATQGAFLDLCTTLLPNECSSTAVSEYSIRLEQPSNLHDSGIDKKSYHPASRTAAMFERL